MNIHTSLGSERIAVAAVANPGSLSAATHDSGWVDLRLYTALMAVIATGTLGASATLDAKWQVADDSSGTNVVDATGVPALTQIVKASGDSKQATMDLDPSKLTTATTKFFARLRLTVGTAASDCVAVVLGINPRSIPAGDGDPASVVQNV